MQGMRAASQPDYQRKHAQLYIRHIINHQRELLYYWI